MATHPNCVPPCPACDPVMDKGPWRVTEEGNGRAAVASDDFKHDVLLRIDGDFADNAQRLAYCEWLAATLNTTGDDRG